MSSFVKDTQGIKFLFGKYHGLYLHDIKDIDYLIWIVREHAENNTFIEELVHEIELELKCRGIDILDEV